MTDTTLGGVRPSIPPLASLPPLPVTRLPLRVRQHHKTIAAPLRNGPGNAANTAGPPARRPGRWRSGERVQLVVHREGDRPAGAPHPRVTRRPPCGSDSSYGPCGPACTGAGVLAVHDDSRDAADCRTRDRSTPRAAACFRSRVNLRAAGSRPWVPPARDSSETAGTIILRMAGNILK